MLVPYIIRVGLIFARSLAQRSARARPQALFRGQPYGKWRNITIEPWLFLKINANQNRICPWRPPRGGRRSRLRFNDCVVIALKVQEGGKSTDCFGLGLISHLSA